MKGSASWKALPRACSSGDAGEGRGEHDDGQADQAHGGQMQGQPVISQVAISAWTISLALSCGLRWASSSRSYASMMWRTGSGSRCHSRTSGTFHQDAGEQTAEEHGDGDGDMRTANSPKMPTGLLADDEVLGLADQGADAPSAVPMAACIIRLRKRPEIRSDAGRRARRSLVIVVQIAGLIP